MLTLATPEFATLATFVAASLALNVTPGADMMFAAASGAGGGRRAGVAAALGINLGVVLHIALAAAGVAALIAASPLAYDAIRFAGAAYLLWLAVRLWRAPAPEVGRAPPPAPFWRIVARGFLINILNPKTALFIFAFLPQFADPDRGAVWSQIAVLGGLFIATGFTVNACVGAAAATAARAAAKAAAKAAVTSAASATLRLRAASTWLNRLSALVFGGLAARLIID